MPQRYALFFTRANHHPLSCRHGIDWAASRVSDDTPVCAFIAVKKTKKSVVRRKNAHPMRNFVARFHLVSIVFARDLVGNQLF